MYGPFLFCKQLEDVSMETKPTYEELDQRVKELEKEVFERQRAEEALQESEERYDILFKNNHSVMLLIDPESADIVDANPVAISYYGWSYEELTCKKITNINTLTEEQIFHEMEQAKKEQRSHFFFRHRLSNGDIRDVEVYSGPLKLHGQQLLYSIIHDITERKQSEKALQASEKRYRLLADNVSDTIWTMDMDLQFTYISPSIKKMTGHSVKERMAMSVEEIMPPESMEIVIKALSEEFALENMEQKDLTRSRILDLEQYCKDGSTIWTEQKTNFMRDQDGKAVGILGITRDITERKRAEEASKKVAALETANVVLENFVSDALGNLLTPIYGHIQLCGIRDNIDQIKSEIEIVEGEIIKLLTGINAYREFFRLGEHSPEKISSTDISYILGPLLSEQPLKTYGNEKFSIDPGVKLRFVYDPKQEGALDWEGLPYVVGDESKIATAIQETLINAVESYGQGKGGDIVVSAKKENYHLILEVTDKGRGMSKEERDKSQLPFFKVLGIKGSGRFGLGAYIARESAKYCGGDIHIESARDVGTTASILLKISD